MRGCALSRSAGARDDGRSPIVRLAESAGRPARPYRFACGGVILIVVEEARTRTLVLPDVRNQDRYLRITWHPSSSTVVFSHWTGPLCTASTPVSLLEASRVIDFLVGALRGVLSERVPSHVGHPATTSSIGRMVDRLRPKRASIVEVRRRLQEQWRRVAP